MKIARLISFVYLGLVLMTSCARIGATEPPRPPKEWSLAQAKKKVAWPVYTLAAEQWWQLNAPKHARFDASGLLLMPDGILWTVDDAGPPLCSIRFGDTPHEAELVPVPDCFTTDQLAHLAKEKHGRYDSEGIARDEQGRIYLSEETDRWILRFDPMTKTVERLPIDWSSVKKYFDPNDTNASFEGVTVGGDILYVANERQEGRIIVIDLKTLKILDDFTVEPSDHTVGDVHYSDLCFFDGYLFALLRENRCVVKIDPKLKKIVGEYSFEKMEADPEMVYIPLLWYFPTSPMEGLAVDKNYFWLCTDNNGMGRKKYPKDIRPTLFKCKRPDI